MSSLSKIITLFNTVKYLKPVQFYARGKLLIKKNAKTRLDLNTTYPIQVSKLQFKQSICLQTDTVTEDQTFSFINLTKKFNEKIDWEFSGYGRLWTYNLNYFEYLDQFENTPENGIKLIDDFISNLPESKTGIEPYPLSLRCLNWIRFFIKHKSDTRYDQVIFSQLLLLNRHLEYHLLGNHLLENGFALLFGAYYFNDNKFYKKAKSILIPELKEQILKDGAHFELSPMYHSTMLFRMLDAYNLVANNSLFNQELKELIRNKTEDMLTWLNNIIFNDGDIPLVNDAAFNIAPTAKTLNDYALRLGLHINKSGQLKESGYRKIVNDKFELLADIGAIGPDYQPGHAHADTFSFELHINGRPVIVDTGTSTYEINSTRFYERSTVAHNTVAINDTDSSQVWGGHRVGKRAKVKIITDLPDQISASHNGYASIGETHQRTFINQANSIIIKDEINNTGIAYLHFTPSENIKINNHCIQGKDYIIELTGASLIECINTPYSPEFNKKHTRKSVRITFHKKLETHFK